MPKAVELARDLPPARQNLQQPPHWIDLGDEGSTLYAAADLLVPELGQRVALSFATAGGEERVEMGVDATGHLTARLYEETVIGPELEHGTRHSLLVRLYSHSDQPDELFVQLGPQGRIPAEPESWTLYNANGRSAANLSRVILHGDSGGFRNVRVAPTRNGLETARVVAE